MIDNKSLTVEIAFLNCVSIILWLLSIEGMKMSLKTIKKFIIKVIKQWRLETKDQEKIDEIMKNTNGSTMTQREYLKYVFEEIMEILLNQNGINKYLGKPYRTIP